MNREIAFMLTVMTISLRMDEKEMRDISGSVVANSYKYDIPPDKDLYSCAIDYVLWQYGKGDKPKWIR